MPKRRLRDIEIESDGSDLEVLSPSAVKRRRTNNNNDTNNNNNHNIPITQYVRQDAPSNDSEPESSDGENYDFWATDPKWSCNVIRGKMKRLINTPGFKITHWCNEHGINSNSYHRFMKLKGAWNGVNNGTFEAASRHFLRDERMKKKENETNKRKSLNERKTMTNTKKQEKSEKQKVLKNILDLIETVNVAALHNDDGPIYDDCNDVRQKINAFLKRGIMNKSRFMKEIGNVQYNSFNKFMKQGPLKLSGASNSTYYKAYHWLEKLRIGEGKTKTKTRLQNESDNVNGFKLRHDSGARWCFRDSVPVLRGDKVVIRNKFGL